MGAIHLQSGVFPQALQREVEELGQEPNGELQAIGLRSLAARLERSQPQFSIQVYDLLAASTTAPEADREVARARLAALQGHGSGGTRWEAMIGRFSGEATDYRTIVPMILASSVAGLVKVAALGRLSSSAGSWFSRGLGARIGAHGLAFAAEVPTFSLSGRALHAWSGEKSGAPLGQELAASALSLACLKGFVGIGAKLSPNPILSTTLFAPAGLYTAHGIEERLGWRSASDSASRAADAIAASLSLSVGARLGGQLLGENFARRQSEFSLRGELALSRPLRMSEWRMTGMPEPLLMSGGDHSGGAKAPEVLGEVGGGEAFGKRELFSRGLRQYREYFGLTLMGDLLRNIEARLKTASAPLRILDIGPRESSLVVELKQRFGDRLAIDSRDQEFLTVDLHEGRYDIILALLGAGSQPAGQLGAVLEKAVDHLDAGGELAAFLSSRLLRGPDALNWRKVEDLSVTRAGLEQGLALRFEKIPGGHLFYAQRLEALRKVPLQELLANPQVHALAADTQSYLEKGLRDQPMRAGGHQWRLDSSSAARLAQALADLGQRNALIVFPGLPQILMDRFILAFHKDHHRLPAAHEIQDWIDGREPSALHSKDLFVDEWLRLQSERSVETRKRSNPIPGLLGLGIGLSAFFGESKAWAVESLHSSVGGDLPAYAIPAAAGLVVLGGLMLRFLSRGKTGGGKAAPNGSSSFELDPRENAYFDKVLTKQFAGRFHFDSDLKKGANWVLQTLLHFYVGEAKSDRDPFHPVGDRLILRAANFDPEYVSRLQPRHQAMLDKVRNRQQAQMDESGLLAWTRSTEPDNSADEITLPGGPKVLGPGGRKGAITLGVGALATFSPQVAEASDTVVRSASLDWAMATGALGIGLLSAYGVVRLVSDLRRQRLRSLLSPVPQQWSLIPPGNEQGYELIENVHYFPGIPEFSAGEVEVLETSYGARWFKLEEPLREGWVKEERQRIFAILNKSHLQEWERELAMSNLVTRLVRTLRRDSEVGEAAKLMWDLSISPKAGIAGRTWLKAAYAAFIHSPLYFGVNGAPVYRECFRLRRIFSDSAAPLKLRIDAVAAYADLTRKLDLNSQLARAESRMAISALDGFLAENLFPRGELSFMTVRGARIDIDNKLFLWRSGQKNGLKAGNEDWEGNY